MELHNLSSQRTVRASEILDNYLRIARMHENYISSINPPEGFGVLSPTGRNNGQGGLDLQLRGTVIQLRSLHALLANGHQVCYHAEQAGIGLLEINIEDLESGQYFVYLVYKDWQPVVSVEKYGQTKVPDIIEPNYELVVSSTIKPLEEYPQCLLLGGFEISAKATMLPKLNEDTLPLISQLGAHQRTKSLLEKTKAQAVALSEASECILSQLQFTPDNSIFRDLKMLADKQLVYLSGASSRISRWDKHTSLFELYCFWFSIAKLFKTWLDSDLVTQRLHSLDMLYRSGARAGQIQMEEYLKSSIDDILSFEYDLNDNSKAVRLVEQFMLYPILAWLDLGDGSPIEGSGNLHK